MQGLANAGELIDTLGYRITVSRKVGKDSLQCRAICATVGKKIVLEYEVPVFAVGQQTSRRFMGPRVREVLCLVPETKN
jgi:hypothetical protein